MLARDVGERPAEHHDGARDAERPPRLTGRPEQRVPGRIRPDPERRHVVREAAEAEEDGQDDGRGGDSGETERRPARAARLSFGPRDRDVGKLAVRFLSIVCRMSVHDPPLNTRRTSAATPTTSSPNLEGVWFSGNPTRLRAIPVTISSREAPGEPGASGVEDAVLLRVTRRTRGSSPPSRSFGGERLPGVLRRAPRRGASDRCRRSRRGTSSRSDAPAASAASRSDRPAGHGRRGAAPRETSARYDAPSAAASVAVATAASKASNRIRSAGTPRSRERLAGRLDHRGRSADQVNRLRGVGDVSGDPAGRPSVR